MDIGEKSKGRETGWRNENKNFYISKTLSTEYKAVGLERGFKCFVSFWS